MPRLNKTAKQVFYVARKRKGDTKRIATESNYSICHVTNVLAGRRSIPQSMANKMYNISRRRIKNSELVTA